MWSTRPPRIDLRTSQLNAMDDIAMSYELRSSMMVVTLRPLTTGFPACVMGRCNS